MLVFEDLSDAIRIELVKSSDFSDWLKGQSDMVRAWVERSAFKGKANQHVVIPDSNGHPSHVVAGLGQSISIESTGLLARSLPAGDYRLDDQNSEAQSDLYLGWGLGAYRYTEYSDADKPLPRLSVDERHRDVEHEVSAVSLARDMINRPPQDMMPHHLEAEARKVSIRHDAEFNVTKGDELLRGNFNTIHAVGRASASEPRLIDLRWGDSSHPKVTILGKGVCFDSGGLDLKSAAQMRSMKKDMGGAATCLGLCDLVMSRGLPVRLRMLIPAVENAVSSNAYHPGDVIRTYSGKTVEVGNTDAEGRLILCDALSLAAEEEPEIMIDFATLTGAARTAVGSDISAMFCNSDEVAGEMMNAGAAAVDPVWRLPLYPGYRRLLKSPIADLCNIGSVSSAGAITAALFLESFVGKTPWVHFDIAGSNQSTRPAKPEGGEPTGLRAVFGYLQSRFGEKN